MFRREKIDLNPVTWGSCTSEYNGKPVGYIRLSTFNQNSAGEPDHFFLFFLFVGLFSSTERKILLLFIIFISAFNSSGAVKKGIAELQSEGVGSFVLDIRNNG